MLKAKGEIDGRPIFLIGLSFANLDRLRADQPIKFDGRDFGFDGDILIFAGATEAAMAESLNIGPETVVHVDPRLKD